MYDYEAEKQDLLTPAGVKQLMKVRDKARFILTIKSRASMVELIEGMLGSSWTNMACIDLLLEIEELREIRTPPGTPQSQREFVWIGD